MIGLETLVTGKTPGTSAETNTSVSNPIEALAGLATGGADRGGLIAGLQNEQTSQGLTAAAVGGALIGAATAIAEEAEKEAQERQKEEDKKKKEEEIKKQAEQKKQEEERIAQEKQKIEQGREEELTAAQKEEADKTGSLTDEQNRRERQNAKFLKGMGVHAKEEAKIAKQTDRLDEAGAWGA